MYKVIKNIFLPEEYTEHPQKNGGKRNKARVNKVLADKVIDMPEKQAKPYEKNGLIKKIKENK